MLDTQLWQLLTTLSSEEQRDFKKWIHSPFFNTRKDVAMLYEYLELVLKEAIPERQKRQAARHKVWAKMTQYKTTIKTLDAAQNAALNFAAHLLSEQLKSFFTYQIQVENKYETHKKCAETYKKRQLDHFLKQEMNDWKKTLEATEKQNLAFFYNSFDYWNVHIEITAEQQRTKELKFEALSENFIHFSIGELLRQWTDMSLHSSITKQVYKLDFIEKSIENYAQFFPHPPVFIQIWLLYFHISKNNEKTDKYFIFKTLLEQNEAIFNELELKNIYVSTINYCIRMANIGDTAFHQELFYWSIKGIDSGVILEQGKLSPERFKNTLRIGLAIYKNDFKKWNCYDFVETNKLLLPEEKREDFYHLALAICHCKTRNFKAALPILNNYKFKDELHTFDVYRLKAIAHFEMDNLDILIDLLSNFKRFVKNKNDVSEKYQLFNLHFIDFLKILTEIQYVTTKKEKKKNLEDLNLKIIAEINVADKEWLMEIILKS